MFKHSLRFHPYQSITRNDR
ncbi:hypothetical protein IFJ82_05805 [Novacetimonas hansenii]|nr:hypothetical protein [Novacetimonas hansenii]PYD72273.1 hypothetical protein CFR74_10635 [Novacetimonas hansenii]QOF96620.1 hypothetical protein IFJ82_05805 [Novacetimonas hansenii]